MRDYIIPHWGSEPREPSMVHSPFIPEEFERLAPPLTREHVRSILRNMPTADAHALLYARIAVARKLKYGV